MESGAYEGLVCVGKAVVLESLPDSLSGAADAATDTQAASSSMAAEAGSKSAGKPTVGVKAKQSLGKRKPSAAASKAHHMTEVVEISDDDDNDFAPDAKVSRARH